MQHLKNLLVGTVVGDWTATARDRLGLMCAAWSDPEKTGMIINDQLASLLVASLCRPGRVFVDVGAHIGSMIDSAQRRSRASKIVAIEAIPAKAAALRRKFPRVEVVECAVGEGGDREVTFFVDRVRSGFSSLARPMGRADDIVEIKVQLRSLGEILAGHDVDVVKIDIEGAELGALRSASEVLMACRPIVMFESGPGAGDRLGYSTSELWKFLDDLDFAVLTPNRLAHDDPGLSLDMFNDSHLYPRRTTNYFAVPRQRRIEIRDLARTVLGIRVS